MVAANSINVSTAGIVGFTGNVFVETPVTNHNIIVGGATSSTLTNVAPSATSGVPLISQGAASNPAFGTAVVAGGGTGAVTLTGVLIGNGTSAVTGNAVTNHNILVGGASNAITSVAPSATSGVALISQGAAADPTFGTVVVAGGGTGQTTLTNHGVLVGAGTSAITQLAAGSAGQVLQSGGASADPTYSTATYPSTATSTGVLLRADGTNWSVTTSTYPATNAVSTLLYASASNVMSALATANNGLLVTSSTGVPSILAGPGTTGNILQSNAAAAPSFSTATYPSTATGTGKILRADGTNWVATTATFPDTAGTSGNVLTSNGTNWTSSAPASSGAKWSYSFVSGGSLNPVDGTLYYFSSVSGAALTTSTGVPQSLSIFIPVTGTLNLASLSVWVQGTLGSAETATASIRLNNSADTTISSSVTYTAIQNTFSNASLGLAVTAGDYIWIKIQEPTWSTNPTNTTHFATISVF